MLDGAHPMTAPEPAPLEALSATPARGQGRRSVVHLVHEDYMGFLERRSLCGSRPLGGFRRRDWRDDSAEPCPRCASKLARSDAR